MNGRTARYLAGFSGAALALSLGSGVALADDAGTGLDLDYLTAEEKLAHDVYTTLGEQWDARQFDRIADSETQHLEAWRTILADLEATDPTAGDALGAFDDPALQSLYDEYVARGLTSLAEAAAVGVEIEQTDISELTAALALTDDPDISRVISQQLAASQRHLAAFERLAATADGSSPTGGTLGETRNGNGKGGQGNGVQAQRGAAARATGPQGPNGDGTQQNGDCDNQPPATAGQPQGYRFGAAV